MNESEEITMKEIVGYTDDNRKQYILSIDDIDPAGQALNRLILKARARNTNDNYERVIV